MAPVMIVTGGSQGIGAAVARLAGARGYAVALTYQSNRVLADAVVGSITAGGGRAIAVQAEMADEASILAMFRTVDKTFGPVTVLVNNAGGPGPTCRLENISSEILDQVLAVNVRAPFLLIREAAARMATDKGGSGGAIVNVSSRAAEIGGAGEWVHYAASKGALDSLTVGAARELAAQGIRVNAVSPGLIETDLHARAGLPDRLTRLVSGVPMGRTGSAEEVAESCALARLGRGVVYHRDHCPHLRRPLMAFKSALIVGTGPGLSASLARLFTKHGLQVAMASRNPDKLAKLAEETAGFTFACEATEPEEVAGLFDAVVATIGTPDIVVYNASARARGPVTDLVPEDVARAIAVSAYGGFLVAQQAARLMAARGSGAILLTGASASVKGYPNSSAFAMGKFALRGLAQSMARELSPRGVHVAHFVIDGGIRSAARQVPNDNPDSLLSPDEIAETYWYVANQHRSAWTWEVELRPWVEKF